MNNYPNERGVRNNNIAPVAGPTYGESPASGPAPTTAGHHKHDIVNKLDPRVDSTKDNRPIANNIPDGTYGPHSSRLANKLDPRVDSDLDSRGPRTTNAAMGGPTMRGAAAGGPVGHANYGHTNNNNIPEGTYGPHSSRMANTLDPRVDSDADRNRAGGMMGGAAGGGAGYGNTGYGQQQQFSNTGATAPGYSNNNNMMSGPGPAPKTAGPHKSDLLNKLDPRVDSKTGEVVGSYGSGAVQGSGGRYA